MNRTIVSILCLISPFTFAEEPAVPPAAKVEVPAKVETPIAKEDVVTTETPAADLPDSDIAQKVSEASEAIGVLMAKSIQSMGINFDTDKIVQGFKEALQGHKKLKSEMECVEIVAHAQGAIFKEIASTNLKQTEEFLAKNKSASGVKELEANKLQYKVEKEGSGPVVEEKSTPLVRYVAKFLGETGDDVSKEENRINLDEEELIPGFRKALIGMKEGEKRTIFIHPDLAFKTKDYNRHTNSLLTFEIEVVKANAPAQQPIDSLSTLTPHGKGNPEIAHPFEDHKAVR
jgi:peptidylprolyl isomerase